MSRWAERGLTCASILVIVFSSRAIAAGPVPGPGLTAAQIVEKNVAARGGIEAWRKIQTMIWTGHIENSRALAPRIPFILEMKRPDKTRFEVRAQSQVSVRIYDGTHGWKVRSGRGGRPEVQPYNAEELIFAGEGQRIGGPLMDYQARGIVVALDGMDEVEGHKAYRLSVDFPSGNSYHLWIDATTFLDLKYDRESRNALGQPGRVSVYNRNFKTVEGLQIPLLIESSAADVRETDEMVIDNITLNAPLDDMLFSGPGSPGRGDVVAVGIEPPQTPVPPSANLNAPRGTTGSGGPRQ